MEAHEEAGLLNIYLMMLGSGRALDADEEMRILTAIRQAIADVPDEGQPRVKRVAALMDRATDLLR